MLEFKSKCGQGAYVEAGCVALGSRDLEIRQGR